jgi:hypothetical protein
MVLYHFKEIKLKNKMKSWRKDAAKFNAISGAKHSGRANKIDTVNYPNWMKMSAFTIGVLNIKLPTLPEETFGVEDAELVV